MNKIYQVIHMYDVDGGFGDSVPQEEVVATFSAKRKAETFVAKYSRPHIYAVPYSSLYCGDLEIREIQVNFEIDRKNMWWLDTKEIEYEEEENEDEEEMEEY